MTDAQVLALEAELRQEEDILRIKEKEIRARREALLLRKSRGQIDRDVDAGVSSSKLQDLENELQKERALTEALKEAQMKFGADGRSLDSTAYKEGQWLMRISALEDELRQKLEKVEALRATEQELEAELRNRLHKGSQLLPALCFAVSNLVALQREHGELPVTQVTGVPLHHMAPARDMELPAGLRPLGPSPVPPLPTYLAQEPSASAVPVVPVAWTGPHRMQSVCAGKPALEVATVPTVDFSPKRVLTSERIPVSRRSSGGHDDGRGSDLKEERWTTPVRRLDASLPTEDSCPSCGTSVPSDAFYCRRCGTRCKDAASIAATVLKTEPHGPRVLRAQALQVGSETPKPGAVKPLTLPAGALGRLPTWSSPAAPLGATGCYSQGRSQSPALPVTAGAVPAVAAGTVGTVPHTLGSQPVPRHSWAADLGHRVPGTWIQTLPPGHQSFTS